jgi:hypothetical protein
MRHLLQEACMSLIELELMEELFTSGEKREIMRRLKEAMSVHGKEGLQLGNIEAQEERAS